MEKLRLGLALTGSYCTYDRVLAAAERLCRIYEVTAILSERAACTDSRFGRAEDFIRQLEEMTGRPVIRSIVEAEPIGPHRLFDVLVVAPCTGNTLAKLALGITDSSVTMAAKAHLRNGRPLVVAVSTNDGLAANAVNLGTLLGRKNVYLAPFRQDDPIKKPASLVADFEHIEDAVKAALEGKQLQPLLL
jgi:dipicolinate synthase subunit B